MMNITNKHFWTSWLYRVTANASYIQLNTKKYENDVNLEDYIPIMNPVHSKKFKYKDWSNMPDEVLLTREVLLDKKENFETVVLPHLSYLYRVAFCLVRKNKEDSEDLVQETIIKAYKSFQQLNHNEKCRAWLTFILYNTFRNKYKKEKENPVILQPIEGSIEEGIAYQDDPENKILGEVMYQGLLKALLEPPEEYSTVVIFSNMQGVSYNEISDILGISIGTVRSRLSRGRQLLRSKLYQYGKEGVYPK
jgi:RNA polymerase sigma-70 factor, ECF subfamily